MKLTNLVTAALLSLSFQVMASDVPLLDNDSKLKPCDENLECLLSEQGYSFILSTSGSVTNLALLDKTDVRDVCLIINSVKQENIDLSAPGVAVSCR